MRVRLLILASAVLLPACAGSIPVLGGKRNALRPGEVPQIDSADARRAARAAQARFESTRWSHLPWTWRSGAGTRCDEIVGRFCIWFDEGGSRWTPPDEPERVVSARASLIGMLAAAGDAHSSDSWIVGQHVRYLVEAGRLDEAADVARHCAAERWWCLALAGYVRHARADFMGAEAAYDDALRAMPDEERRRWTDLSLLIEPASRKSYRRLDAASRAAMERRFWWLSDPMYSVPGNERRAEHFTRHVLARLGEDARSPERVSWGDDVRELLLRYGSAAGWERVRPSGMSMERPSVVSHFARGGRRFEPAWALIDRPAAITLEQWPLEVATPRTEYAPAYADAFHELEQQVAVFRRGDSVRVVAAWRVPSDSFPDTASVEAAMVLARGEQRATVTERITTRGRRGALAVTSAERPVVLSLELLARGARQAARARFGVPPPRQPRALVEISDLLLIDVRDPPPASLEEAIPLARSDTRLRTDERVGVFWEVYGEDELPRQTFVTLSLTRGRVGWARRLAERIGLRSEFDGLKLQWEERTGAPIAPRAVALDFSRLEPGEYSLELVVAPVGRPAATAARTIEIVRP